MTEENEGRALKREIIQDSVMNISVAAAFGIAFKLKCIGQWQIIARATSISK